MMPHIDDGALHAYLDGALTEYPVAEAEQIRRHLADCAVCQERLEDARTIRDQAASILGGVTPSVEAPSFEELRAWAQAGVPSGATGANRLHRMGWAASVVLALGMGWALRGEQATPGPMDADDSPPIQVVLEEPGERPESEPERTEVAGLQESTGEASGRNVRFDRPTQPAPLRLDDGVLLSARTGPVVAEPVDDAPPLPDAPPIEVSSPQVQVMVVSRAADSAVSDVSVRDTRPSPEPIVSASSVAPTLGVSSLGRSPEPGRAETDAPAVTEVEYYSLVVPGIELIEVRFRGAGVRPEGQVVLQRLETGDTLRVIHLPPEVDLATLEEASPLDRQLVVQTSAGWVVMRAPVSDEVLFDLMRRLLTED